jgi:hypothetical protein
VRGGVLQAAWYGYSKIAMEDAPDALAGAVVTYQKALPEFLGRRGNCAAGTTRVSTAIIWDKEEDAQLSGYRHKRYTERCFAARTCRQIYRQSTRAPLAWTME